LRLPEFAAHHAAQSALAATEGWSCDQYLLRLCEMEINGRETRKRQKLLHASRLPREKTLETFERNRLRRNVESTGPPQRDPGVESAELSNGGGAKEEGGKRGREFDRGKLMWT